MIRKTGYNKQSYGTGRVSDLERKLRLSEDKQIKKRMEKRKIRAGIRKRKVKNRLKLGLFAFLIFFIPTCIYIVASRLFFTDTPDAIPDIRQRLNDNISGKIKATDTKGRKLTGAEMAADFDILAERIEALPKENRSDIEKDQYLRAKEDAKKEIRELKNDEGFYEILKKFAKLSCGENVKILDLAAYNRAVKNLAHGIYEKSSPYAKILSHPRVKSRYSRMIPIEEGLLQKQPTLKKNGTGLILSGLSFDEGDIESAKKTIPGFISQAKTASSLTIDLRGLDGTSQSYWLECIAPYLVSGSYHAESYLYFGKGFDDFVDYLSTEEKSQSIDLEDGREEVSYRVPESIRKKIEDTSYQKKLTASVVSQRMRLEPDKLIFLVDGKTKNAAESFADFFQYNKLATVVGEKTFGNAWDIPPFYLMLDHSGYVASFDITLQQNLNGTGLTMDSQLVPDR